MSKKRELIKNTGIIFISKLCTQFISFLLLPFYTAYLSTGEYGTIDLITTYITLLYPILTVQLEMAAFRYLIDTRDNIDEQKKILSSIVRVLIMITMVLGIIALIALTFINLKYKYLILANIVVCIFSNLFIQVSRGLGKIKEYSVASFITGVSTIILNVILIVFVGLRVEAMLISMMVANLLAMTYLFIKLKLRKLINLKIKDNKLVKELIKYSIPLVPNCVSWWLITVSDRTIISIFMNISANGIYAISNKFSILYLSLFNIFNLSWQESSAKHINDKDSDYYFSEVINTAIKMFASLLIFTVVLLPFVFNFLVNNAYQEAYLYIPILMIASLFNSVAGLYSSIYIAKKLTKEIMVSTLVASIINVVLNLAFINLFGLYAACISTLIAYFILFIYRYFDLKKYLTIKYDTSIIFTIIPILIIAVALYYVNNLYTNIINLLLCAVVLVYYNRKEIKALFALFNKKFRQIRS